jgi:hypothetical protein
MRSRALSDSRLLGVDPINPDGDGETIPGSHVRFWRKPEARFVAAASEKIGCSAWPGRYSNSHGPATEKCIRLHFGGLQSRRRWNSYDSG